MLSNVQIITKDDGTRVAVAFGYSDAPLLADETHPNFKTIVQRWLDGDAFGFADLFDIPKAITKAFSRLSQRVTVKDGIVFFDGDEVHGHVVDSILSFMDAGEDVSPLVSFYEKLTTNPLGNVQEGIFSWITGQKAEGNFTITPEGNVLGYKAVTSTTPSWRKDAGAVVYRPSWASNGGDIVNDEVVPEGAYLEQVVGDVVEMPRSQVLNKPSQECGVGLHIGTYAYAKSYTGDTILLVEFDPRDVVSLPDSNSDWKLRVCRYKVVGIVDAPLEVPLFITEAPVVPAPVEPEADDDLDVDDEPVYDVTIDKSYGSSTYVGEPGRIVQTSTDGLGATYVEFQKPGVGPLMGNRGAFAARYVVPLVDHDAAVEDAEADLEDAEDYLADLENGFTGDDLDDDEYDEALDGAKADVANAKAALDKARSHGKGGSTSQAAKGRGLNPAQDPKTGQFVAGRPGSARDTSTGRFA